jgi:hypothetical protein
MLKFAKINLCNNNNKCQDYLIPFFEQLPIMDMFSEQSVELNFTWSILAPSWRAYSIEPICQGSTCNPKTSGCAIFTKTEFKSTTYMLKFLHTCAYIITYAVDDPNSPCSPYVLSIIKNNKEKLGDESSSKVITKNTKFVEGDFVVFYFKTNNDECHFTVTTITGTINCI